MKYELVMIFFRQNHRKKKMDHPPHHQKTHPISLIAHLGKQMVDLSRVGLCQQLCLVSELPGDDGVLSHVEYLYRLQTTWRPASLW